MADNQNGSFQETSGIYSGNSKSTKINGGELKNLIQAIERDGADFDDTYKDIILTAIADITKKEEGNEMNICINESGLLFGDYDNDDVFQIMRPYYYPAGK
jgi:hypothetical protein